MQGWGPWTLNLINTGVLDQRSLEFTKLFVTKKQLKFALSFNSFSRNIL